MNPQDLIGELEQEELTPEQAGKLAEVKRLLAERGVRTNLTRSTPNQQQQSFRQGYAPAKTFAQGLTEFATRDVPEIGAATVGGLEGATYAARIPAPPQIRPFVIGAGSVIGGTTGLLAAREGLKTLDRGTIPSADEKIADAKRALGETITGEGMGYGLRLLGRGYKLGKQYITAGRPATVGEMQTFENAQQMGVHLRPADVTMSPQALRTEQTLRGTQAGTDIFKRRDLLNQENFSRAFETELLDTVATKATPQERGKLIQDVIEGRAIPEYQEMARRGYEELLTITGGEKIVLPTEAFALAKELSGTVTAETNPKAAGIINKVLDQLGQPGAVTGLNVRQHYTPGDETTNLTGITAQTTSRAPSTPRPLDFMEAHDIRSMLGELGSTGEQLPKKAQGIANKLWSILGLEMEQGAIKYQQKTGIPVVSKWRQADSVVREQGHALFDSNVISNLIKSHSEDVVQATLKKGGLTEVQTVVKALSRIKDEPGLEQYRRGVLEHLWDEGIVMKGVRRGEFSGTQFADASAKYGDDVLRAALGPVYPRFQKFLEVAKHMDPKSAAGQGVSLMDKGLLITAPLVGVGGSILKGNILPLVSAAGSMGTWLISTRQLSKMLNDPQKAGQLLRVMKTKPGTETWTRAVGNLTAIEIGERVIAPSLPPIGQLRQAP